MSLLAKIKKNLIKFIRNPIKTIKILLVNLNKKLEITTSVKVSSHGERLVIKNWNWAIKSKDFSTLAHIQRYYWAKRNITDLFCLDLGCGSGYGTYFLANNRVTKIIGIDISSEAINYANSNYKSKNIEFLQMNSLKLNFENNFFDAVISFDVIEHIDERDHDKFLSEIVRVLKKDGILLIGCPNATVSSGKNPFHKKELTKDEFELLLKKYFQQIKIFGQDIIINGIKMKENWHNALSNLSFQNMVIIENDCESSFGLLALCKNPLIYFE